MFLNVRLKLSVSGTLREGFEHAHDACGEGLGHFGLRGFGSGRAERLSLWVQKIGVGISLQYTAVS